MPAEKDRGVERHGVRIRQRASLGCLVTRRMSRSSTLSKLLDVLQFPVRISEQNGHLLFQYCTASTHFREGGRTFPCVTKDSRAWAKEAIAFHSSCMKTFKMYYTYLPLLYFCSEEKLSRGVGWKLLLWTLHILSTNQYSQLRRSEFARSVLLGTRW